jgi:methylmalonyl-CoA mutase N-terminal domain/subunit
VVGVNRWAETDEAPSDIRTVGTEDLAKRQADRLAEWRADRDSARVEQALEALTVMASGEANVMPGIRAACSAGATVGEIANVFRDIAGTYRDPAVGRP